MKILALMIFGLLVVGCGDTYPPPMPPEKTNTSTNSPPKPTDQNTTKPTPEKSDTSTNSPPKPTDRNGTKPTPTKELSLGEKVAGSYEGKKDGFTFRVVLLENGIVEFYNNGEKEEGDGKWKIIDGELHANDGISVGVLRRNKDNSITYIARMKDGKREEVPKEHQVPLKKIE